MARCFNPRPRAAGDIELSWLILNIFVSIHARARRATYRRTSSASRSPGFNPRPRAAGDKNRLSYCHAITVSIHARARRATGDLVCLGLHLSVSIHARARRATYDLMWHQGYCTCFNPRPRAAGDLSTVDPHSQLIVFQSTPARGGRPRPLIIILSYRPVSIHARARRATAPNLRASSADHSFNPRPRAAGDSFLAIRAV